MDAVVVAMSGGVDSSVAAALLAREGYRVVGLFMRLGAEPVEADACEPSRHQGCCSAADAADARRVAGQLGIGFYALNFRDEFDRIIDYFADEYAAGRTPNPCIVCNQTLKFGRLLAYADAVGARYVATGHYARIGTRDGQPVLRRGVDADKDQSYALFGIDRHVLPRVRFPVGAMTKNAVRAAAHEMGLPVHAKPDSTEICFVPDRDYARVVRQRRPEAFRPGEVRDHTGKVVGSHDGLPQFTIGQRRGLGIALGKPVYVTQIDPAANTVTLGPREKLARRGLLAGQVNWLVDPPTAPFRAAARIRYQHRPAEATVEPLAGDRIRVLFDAPQPAVTPGQAVVLYDNDIVLGGAWIDEAVP